MAVFLYQITVILQQNTTASLLELSLMTQCKLYARGGAGGCGSQQREVADGADVVFTDTAIMLYECLISYQSH